LLSVTRRGSNLQQVRVERSETALLKATTRRARQRRVILHDPPMQKGALKAPFCYLSPGRGSNLLQIRVECRASGLTTNKISPCHSAVRFSQRRGIAFFLLVSHEI